MLVAAAPISNFVNKHPAFKVLALSFLMLIGFTLLVEGFDVHIPKGYVYFAMSLSKGGDLVIFCSSLKRCNCFFNVLIC